MGTGLVDEQDFRDLIEKRAQTLLGLLHYLAVSDRTKGFLTRPLLGELLSQAMQLEELLDTYDAAKNCRWCNLRSVTAAVKLFSDVSYELLHIRHRVPNYRLLSVEQDFLAATDKTLEYTGDILVGAAKAMLVKAREAGLKIPSTHNREDS